MAFLTQCFSVEVGGYAVMSNHLHVVVHMAPEDVGSWSTEAVAQRWLSIYPAAYAADGSPMLPVPAVIQARARDGMWIAERRKRLADLGWFMKALKETISKRANREDDCTGAFWEGRFSSVPILDQGALMACLAYVDLNPIRAKMCDRPERARFTGAWQRIRVRQRERIVDRLRVRDPDRAERLLARTSAMEGSWLAPLERCIVGDWTTTNGQVITPSPP